MDEYAKLAFSKGIRAVYSEGEPEFSNLEGKQIPWSSLDNWLALRQYQLIKEEASATWKERHAKGVPVKMTIEEFYASTMTGYSYPCVRYFNDGYPDARMLDNLQNSYARFCNFRYKPEWLEKNKSICKDGCEVGDGSCYHLGCAIEKGRKHK